MSLVTAANDSNEKRFLSLLYATWRKSHPFYSVCSLRMNWPSGVMHSDATIAIPAPVSTPPGVNNCEATRGEYTGV